MSVSNELGTIGIEDWGGRGGTGYTGGDTAIALPVTPTITGPNLQRNNFDPPPEQEEPKITAQQRTDERRRRSSFTDRHKATTASQVGLKL